MKEKLLSLVDACISSEDFLIKSEDSESSYFHAGFGTIATKTGVYTRILSYCSREFVEILNIEAKRHSKSELIKDAKYYLELDKHERYSKEIVLTFRDKPGIVIGRKIDYDEKIESFEKEYKLFGFIKQTKIYDVKIRIRKLSYEISCGEFKYDIDEKTVESIYKSFHENKLLFENKKLKHIIDQRIIEFSPKLKKHL